MAEAAAGIQGSESSANNEGSKKAGAEIVQLKGGVSAICPGAIDSRGQKVVTVFFKRPAYAIYRTEQGIAVQFSDKDEIATEQIKAIADLLPLRNKLQYLAKNLRAKDSHENSKSEGIAENNNKQEQEDRAENKAKAENKATRTDELHRVDEPECYFFQIADATRLGLENNIVKGKEILEGAIENVTSLLERHGRLCYLQASAKAVLYITLAWIICMAATVLGWLNNTLLTSVATAVFSGATGALLSVAIGIRNRTVALDGDPSGNRMEATVRITIGVISAAVLYLLFTEKFFSLFGLAADKADDLRAPLLIGFAGGFLERLVPDLLEKSASRGSTKKTEPS